MDDPLGVGVLDGLADRHEERQALGDAQAGVVAVLRDGDALDVVHDDEGPAALGLAAVEHLGDVGVVHQSQGLALHLEARQDGPRVHPRLDELHGHLAADRLDLLGRPDRAHAPFADCLEQLVAAGHQGVDGPPADAVGRRPGGVSRRPRRRDRPVEDAEGLFVGREQALNPLAEGDVVGAGLFQEGQTIGRERLLQRGGEQRLFVHRPGPEPRRMTRSARRLARRRPTASHADRPIRAPPNDSPNSSPACSCISG